jgi:hypothetical protein
MTTCHKVVEQCSPSFSQNLFLCLFPYLSKYTYFLFGLRFNTRYHIVQNKDLKITPHLKQFLGRHEIYFNQSKPSISSELDCCLSNSGYSFLFTATFTHTRTHTQTQTHRYLGLYVRNNILMLRQQGHIFLHKRLLWDRPKILYSTKLHSD